MSEELHDDPDALIGVAIAGRYVIERPIGRGGMGVVYLARQQPLDRQVVVKVLRANLVDDEESIARFEREAQGLSKLQHPNVVTIHDFGWDDEGDRAYIAMEYVGGETLGRRIRADGPMAYVDFLPLAVQLLQGIGAAHNQGLLHRDIKPANVMLKPQSDQGDAVKILDFGLAKLTTGDSDITKQQSLVGSVGYLAPEQIVGEDTDHRLDIYAMGVLFYYMLSGEKPFREQPGDDDLRRLFRTVHEEPVPLSEMLPEDHDVPDGVINLIHMCLAKHPDERPGSARELLESMARISPTGIHASLTLPAEGEVDDPVDPPTSLELTAPSGSFSLVRDPSSGKLQLIAADGTDVSAEHSLILGAPDAKRSSSAPIIIIVALLVVAGVVAAVVLSSGSDDATPPAEASTAPSETANPTALRADLQTELDAIRARIDEGALVKAESALDTLAQGPLGEALASKENKDLRERVSDYRAAIAIAQLENKATLFEESGDLKAALATYIELLAQDPEHPIAQVRVAELRGKLEPTTGTVQLTVTPAGATATIPGQPPLTTPFDHPLPPGTHTITVEADGYDTHTTSVTVVAGQTHTLALELTKTKSSKSSKSSSKRDDKKDSGDSGSTNSSDTTIKDEKTKKKGDLLLIEKSDKKKKLGGGLLAP